MNAGEDFNKSDGTYEGNNAPVPVESTTDAPYPCCLEMPDVCVGPRLKVPGRLGRRINIIACRTEDMDDVG